ncbi:hypothetical protein ATPR_0743 [Acetobacter tropicalis NBRC 101654]|uniref:Uncharacterized protein n=1 Tax=Acetobacter tropicalis NBRC 101654 TaxID=749388 RepID=F7VBJ3_9PROT|nr:hypothetical protein ATPR_0743 [Acetobacter tropicalis NBRC 101654]
MSGAVHVSVVTLRGFVFHVSRGNGDATSAFFRSSIDLVVCFEVSTAAFCQRLRDSSRQRRLAMVNVADGADVAVRFIPLKFSLSHFSTPYLSNHSRGSFQISLPLPLRAKMAPSNDYQR